MSDPITIINELSTPAILVDQNADTGNQASSSGAIVVNNSDNPGIGLNIYSNAGEQTGAALVFVKQDNVLAARPAVRIVHDGISPAVRIEATNVAQQNSPAVQITNDSSSGIGLKIIHSNINNSQGLIVLQGASPEIEYVEDDQTAPAGKFETRVQNDHFTINGRNAADNSFENIVLVERMADGGEFRLVGFLTLTEQASAPTGTANQAKLFTEDNGAGKTRLMVQFGSGAAQQLAIEA